MVKKIFVVWWICMMQLNAMSPEWDQPAILYSLSETLAYEETDDVKYVKQFHREYFNFLLHISGRVDAIEEELANSSQDSASSWPGYASSWAHAAWTRTKKVAHDARSFVANPASEDMAQKLSDKILIMQNLSKSNGLLWITPQEGAQQLLVSLQGKISVLQDKYRDSASATVQTHLGYLKEYNDRINQLENEFQAAFNNKWQYPH